MVLSTPLLVSTWPGLVALTQRIMDALDHGRIGSWMHWIMDAAHQYDIEGDVSLDVQKVRPHLCSECILLKPHMQDMHLEAIKQWHSLTCTLKYAYVCTVLHAYKS